MQEIKEIGNTEWSRDEIKNSIPEFLNLYQQRPVRDNEGGMKAPHMFAAWFMLKKINPAYVIESGIWKGQGTWLFEKTLPAATICSIDINLSIREYISDDVIYFDKDFFDIDWSFITEKDNTLLFFDDHQNALERIIRGNRMGFKKLIFEDNYPSRQGDCYSLKKAFQHSGFSPEKKKMGIRMWMHQLIHPVRTKTILPNSDDAAFLKKVLDIYYEFPPVFIKNKTRWGDDWDEHNYPTPPPLYDRLDHDYLKVFEEEAISYTWICYARLR